MESNRLPIIFDCDPGADDALMLLMALASPEVFDVLAITTVAGNVDINNVNNNALQILELAQRQDIKVYSGCQRPMIRASIDAAAYHGESGLGGATLPPPHMTIQSTHAVTYLLDTLKSSSRKIRMSLSGPMTNLATALVCDPSIATNIAEVVFMGGSTGRGNMTPYAEFNMLVDPHAAHVIMSSCIPLRMIGLNVTEQVCATEARIAAIEALNNAAASQVGGILRFGLEDHIRWGFPGRCIHDACIVAALLRPNLFEFSRRKVTVEHIDEVRIGESVVSELSDDETMSTMSGVMVAYSVKVDDMFELVNELLSRFRASGL